MSKDPKFFDTQKLMVYSEIFTKMELILQEFGEIVFMNSSWGGISEEDAKEVHDRLAKQQDIIETKRILFVKEITERIKKDTGINRGPGDIDIMINKIYEKHPILFKGESEIKAAIEEDKIKKPMMEVLKNETIKK